MKKVNNPGQHPKARHSFGRELPLVILHKYPGNFISFKKLHYHFDVQKSNKSAFIPEDIVCLDEIMIKSFNKNLQGKIKSFRNLAQLEMSL